jgi:hypothetical protein
MAWNNTRNFALKVGNFIDTTSIPHHRSSDKIFLYANHLLSFLGANWLHFDIQTVILPDFDSEQP